MKKLTFTHEDKTFTLDLEKGELTGDDPKLLERMHYHLKKGIDNGYAGEFYESIVTVDITDPYRDPYQFTACVIRTGYLHPIPKELEPYKPELHEERELRELEEKIKEAQKGKPESEHARIRQELEDDYREWKKWESEINEDGFPNVMY